MSMRFLSQFVDRHDPTLFENLEHQQLRSAETNKFLSCSRTSLNRMHDLPERVHYRLTVRDFFRPNSAGSARG